jgi:hypothetical protein
MKEDTSSPANFDIKVTHYDRSGAVVKQDPYTLIVAAAHEGGKTRLWERPKNSGNIFDRHGKPCGRIIRNPETGKSKYVKGEPHVFVPPVVSKEEQLLKQTSDQALRIKALEAELAAVRYEAEPKRAELKPKAANKADEV